jgi:hypothetical protein
MTIIAIDPGLSGGMCFAWDDKILLEPLPFVGKEINVVMLHEFIHG